MNSQEYWRRRQIEREKKWHDLTTAELKSLKKYYISAGKEIEKEIALLYAKFARENALPPEEARKLIRGAEFKQWRMTLKEYVAKSKADPKLLRELNTLAMRSRISRIEAIHGRTLIELAELSERLQETADAHFYRAYVENYYQNVYDYHKTIGLPQPPASLDAKRVESILQTAWSGKNYSARIWANRSKLTKEIQRSMMTAIHRGSSIQQLSKDLAQRMEVGYKNAERLIRTELNAVENKASADAMKDAEFTHYQFMATLDRRTCIRCGERDGEIFALKDMNQGENAPPLHPRCRCTIVATFDTPKSKSRTSQERAARDFGNSPKGKTLEFETVKSSRPNATIETPFGKVNVGNVKGKIVDSEAGGHYKRVPADMTYKEWKAVYIDGELQRRSANQGAFAHLQVPMQLKTVKQV